MNIEINIRGSKFIIDEREASELYHKLGDVISQKSYSTDITVINRSVSTINNMDYK